MTNQIAVPKNSCTFAARIKILVRAFNELKISKE